MRAHYYFSTALDEPIIQGPPIFKGVHYCLRISNPERSLVPPVLEIDDIRIDLLYTFIDLLYTLIDLLYTLKKQGTQTVLDGSRCAHYSRV